MKRSAWHVLELQAEKLDEVEHVQWNKMLISNQVLEYCTISQLSYETNESKCTQITHQRQLSLSLSLGVLYFSFLDSISESRSTKISSGTPGLGTETLPRVESFINSFPPMRLSILFSNRETVESVSSSYIRAFRSSSNARFRYVDWS